MRIRGIATALLLSAAPATAIAADDEAAELGLLFDIPVPLLAASKSRTPEDAGRSVAHVVVIDAEEIRTFGWRTLAELLSGVAEIHLAGERYWPTASVRGVARSGDYNQRILVLLDGHVLNDAISDAVGIDDGLPIFLGPLVERVEVVIGPVSPVYGSNAFFGAVNVVTRKPERRTWGAVAEAGTGEHGRIAGWYGDAGRTGGGTPWQVQAFVNGGSSEGEAVRLDSPEGPRTERNADWNRNGAAYLRGSFGRMTASAFVMGRRHGQLAGVYDRPGSRGSWYERTRATGIAECAALRGESVSVTVRGYVNETDTRGRSVDVEPDLLYLYRVFSEELGAEVIGEWRHGPSTLVVSAEDFYQRNADSHGYESDNPDWLDTLEHVAVVDNVLRGSVHERLTFGPVTIQGGAYAEDSRLHGFAVAPGGGVVVEPARGTTVKALWARGFRRPSFYEYGAEFEDWYPQNGIVVPHLVPEWVDSAELLVRQRVSRHIELTVDGWHAEYRRMIALDRTDFLRRNSDRFLSNGATAALVFRSAEGSIRADASVLDARDRDDRRLVGSPSWIGHATARIRVSGRATAGFRVSVVGPRSDPGGALLPTSSFLDASADARLTEGLRLNLSVTNIGGTRHDVPVDGYRSGFHPLPGRAAWAALSFER